MRKKTSLSRRTRLCATGLAAASLVGMSNPVMAAFPAEINLSDLDGTNGFAMNGIDTNDQSGYSVAAAEDINGDGIDDVIIGAYDAAPNGQFGAGESYVVFGTKPPPVNDLVAFVPQPPVTTTSDTEGCPASFVGKFTFDAALTNISVNTLSKLQVDLDTLRGNNVLLTDAGVVQEGETFPVPELDGYTDGLLSPDEWSTCRLRCV